MSLSKAPDDQHVRHRDGQEQPGRDERNDHGTPRRQGHEHYQDDGRPAQECNGDQCVHSVGVSLRVLVIGHPESPPQGDNTFIGDRGLPLRENKREIVGESGVVA